MDTRQLRCFLEVAERRTFTRAAESLHVSQPSLSMHIAALEEELGVPLFDRLGRHVALTEAGRLLREYAERGLREFEQGVQAIQELKGAKRGRLLIGALFTVNAYFLPQVVCRFLRQFPDVRLQVLTQSSAEIVANVSGNRLDLGLCVLPIPSRRVTTTPLFEEQLSLVVPADSRLPARRLRIRELADLPLVLMPADYWVRQMIEEVCSRARARLRVSAEVASLDGLLETVVQGAGLTILPERYVRHRLADSTVRLIELYDPVPMHSVGLVYRTRRHLSLAAQAFIRLCQAVEDEPKPP